MKRLAATLAMAAGLALAAAADAADLPEGALTIVGSDSLSPLVARWAAAFHAAHPQIRIQAHGAGSASAPAALASGAADFGTMSRPMSPAETAAFAARYGREPTGIVVAHDAIAVFVHPDNPLRRLTLPQLDAMYSDTRRCGAGRAIRTWADLGEADFEPARPLLASGRNDASGTHELFREVALCGGAYRAGIVAWPGNGAVVATVAGNREAIGYAGVGYVNALVRPLALARDDADAGVLPERAAVAAGRYPLARPALIYFNRAPGRAPRAAQAAFLAYVLSDAGQAQVRQEGLFELDAAERAAQRAALAE